MTSMTCESVRAHESDDGYPQLERLVAERVRAASGPVLQTDVPGLFQDFLVGLPCNRQYHYNCNCCRRFVEKYGAAVRVSDDGKLETVLWEPDGVPEFFRRAVENVRRRVLQGKVAGVLLSDEKVWGTPESRRDGEVIWTHLSGTPSSAFKHPLKTADQAAAEKREEYAMLRRGLAEFPKSVVEQAVRFLESDVLDRGEKTVELARWLLSLHQQTEGLPEDRKANLLWREAAKAPPGWCHVRSGMIGTLLEDLSSGLPSETVRARWNAKMHPLKYQRPTTVKSGTIERAEKIVGELKSAGALERRFARLEDVHALWHPTAEEVPAVGGVFGHLKASKKPQNSLELPQVTSTWEKFARTVLPDVLSMEVLVPSHGAFFGMVTAANPEAPPIIQWDTDPRNPVTWYFYHGGSYSSNWGLSAGSYCRVNAVCEKPSSWFHPDKFKHQGRDIFLVLDGCRDKNYTAGAAFFPEQLRSEYHEIRSVMEAYARTAVLANQDGASANGLSLGQSGFTLRVRTRLGVGTYKIDRLD